MKIITRYLFKDIFRFFIIFVSVLAVLLMVYEVYDTREEFVERAPSFVDSLEFLVCSIPLKLSETLPIIGLLATIFAYGLLAKNKEILAMVAAGISFRRLAIPAVVFGVLISLGTFWFKQVVVPMSEQRARYLEKVVLQGKKESIFTRSKDLFVKGKGNRFYIVESFDSTTKAMNFPTIMEINPKGNTIAERIEAVSGKLVAGPEGKDQFWEFSGAERWVFNDDGSLKNYEKFNGPYQIVMDENLDKFLSKTPKPEEMGMMEMREYIQMSAERGVPDLARYEMAFYHMLVFPVSCLLLTLIGFAVVTDVHARRFALGVFTGLVLAIGFYILSGFLQKMGEKNEIMPLMASLLPFTIFLVLAGLLVWRLDQIRS